MRVSLLAWLLVATACASENIDREVIGDELTVSAIPRSSVWRYWDRGGDLGTSWRGTFDDASWSSGAGPLGFGETYLTTTVSAGPITTYFRRTFTVDDPAAVTAMAGEVMYDDGFVVYLNGVEIGRDSMPTGTVTATTLSTGHEAGNAYRTYDWTARKDLLVAGTNTIAVEVHQVSTSSSDLVFDLSLALETAAPPPPTGGDDIARGSAWWYWDNGGDLGTAWRRLGGAATGWASGDGPLGYGESYLRTTLDNGGITAYFRRELTIDDPAQVISIAGELMYDDGFVVYLNGTEIQRGAMPSGTITASTLSTGHEANNAYLGYDWTARKDLLVAGVNVIAVEVHQVSASSSDLVFDASLTIETGASPPPPVDLGGIARRSDWWFWDVGGAPETNWKTVDYGSPPWDAGFAPFGFGESYLQTQLTPGYITYYFKESFYADNPSAVTSMLAEVMYDDGVVVYLNGTEILRASMPSGTVTSTTLASGHEAENKYVSFDLTAKRNLLVAGLNVIAVEVHQVSASSSDVVFDLALRLGGNQPPPPSDQEDIARGSVWAYWDRLEAPSTYDYWAEPDYNDAVWERGAGPLGYGESYLRTIIDRGPITAYFRRWFTVDDPSVQTRMLLELMYDDGIVVHLNGREIKRMQMGDGWSIEHDTLATTSHEAGNTYEVFDVSAFNGYLRRGLNLLAVEVHQHSATSSDLVFDVALQIDTPPVCAIAGGGPGLAPVPGAGLGDVWVGATTAFAVAGDGTIGRRAADGPWCWSRALADGGWSAVWGSADDDVWFIGPDGRVARYDGTAFARVDVGATKPLTGIWGSGPDDIWIVGGDGTIRHFDGTSWHARDLPPDQDLLAIWGASPDDVWISGVEPAPYPGDPNYDGTSGVIYRWLPATGTWQLELRNTMYYGYASFSALDGTSPTNIWAVGYDHPAGAACSISTAYRYDGVSWSYAADAPTECRDLADVAVGAAGATDGAWIVGSSEAGIGASRFTGGVWEDVPSPNGFYGTDHEGDRLYGVGMTFASSPHQFIVRWDGSRFVTEW